MKFVIEYIYEIIYDLENKFFLKTASDLRRSAMFVVLLGLEKLRWAYEANYSGEYLPLLEKSVRDIMDRLMIASLNEK